MDPVFPRLHLVTDCRPGRDALSVVAAAVAVAPPGLLAVQVRVEDDVTDRLAYDFALAVLEICRPAEVLCLVNDRLHIAVAVGAAGGHVGADDLPVGAARKVLGRPGSLGMARVLGGGGVLGGAGVLGATCREAVGARSAVRAGASYLGVGPAYLSTTKDGLPEPLGPDGVGAVAAAVPGTPVIAIGGVTAGRVPELRAAGAYGVAVAGALADAADPGRVTAQLVKALG